MLARHPTGILPEFMIKYFYSIPQRRKTMPAINENCPCKNVNCPNHGNCEACRANHHGRGSLTSCERLAEEEKASK